ILNVGTIMSVAFEKVLLLQNPINLTTSQVIDTYVYQVGLHSPIPQYSYATAIGLLRSAIGLILLLTVKQLPKRLTKPGLVSCHLHRPSIVPRSGGARRAKKGPLMTITANRRTVLKAGAAGLGLAGAAPVLAACSGDSVPGGGSGAAAEYEQGSAALEVELGPEIEGVNYPEDYVGPKHRELEPFGDGETEFSMLGRSIPGLSYPENYYANLVEEK